MKSKEHRKIAIELSEGILSSTTDLVLFIFFLTLSSFGKAASSKGTDQMFSQADEALRKINYRTIKNSIIQLKKNNLVSYDQKKMTTSFAITPKGISLIQSLAPNYKTKRTWNGKIYLISYDIPEKNYRERNILRKFISQKGGKMLQKSFYLIPYDPSSDLKKLTGEKALQATILVSYLEKDGFIGQDNLHNLIRKVYETEKIKLKYFDFINKYKDGRSINLSSFAFDFWSIVKKDPQLPFELLPTDWSGNQAFQIFQKYIYI